MTWYHYLSFAALRGLMFPFGFIPYSLIHRIGRILGSIAYVLCPKFRKRALSNLALAKALNLSPQEIRSTARHAMQNLMITCLEYAKLSRETDISRIAKCENPQTAAALCKEGKGPIFFCGHQANWEILFLEGTSRMPGVAIARPIENARLYQWVLKMRQKFGGKIVSRRQAVKEGLRALKGGCFLGIVGDQAMPDSGFCSPFLGRNAWTSPLAALLSYRTGAPIIVATTRREKGKYLIHYSAPLYPDRDAPLETEIPKLMHTTLALFEKSIKDRPGEWLWQHNRWKQQLPGKIKKKFRYDSLCVIMPLEEEQFKIIAQQLTELRSLYPQEEFVLMVPEKNNKISLPIDVEKMVYRTPKDLLIEDYRFKLLFDFAGFPGVCRHFKKLSVFKCVTLQEIDLCHLTHSLTNRPLA